MSNNCNLDQLSEAIRALQERRSSTKIVWDKNSNEFIEVGNTNAVEQEVIVNTRVNRWDW